MLVIIAKGFLKLLNLHKLKKQRSPSVLQPISPFLLFSVIDGFERFWMGSLRKNIQLILEFLKAPFLVLHLSVILLSMLMIVLSKCDQASDLWQQLELASELESDIRDTVDWGRKWLVDFNAGKTQLVLFDRSNNTGAIDVKMDGAVLEEN